MDFSMIKTLKICTHIKLGNSCKVLDPLIDVLFIYGIFKYHYSLNKRHMNNSNLFYSQILLK